MEKISEELIQEFKSIENELTIQKGNLKSLQASLTECEDHLVKSEKELKNAEEFQRSDSLITLKQVQSAREKMLVTKGSVDDARCVCDNINTNIRNATSLIQKSDGRRVKAMQNIWRRYSQIVLENIEQEVGDKINLYLAAFLLGNPGIVPHPFPGRLGDILTKPQELRELQNIIKDEIF